MYRFCFQLCLIIFLSFSFTNAQEVNIEKNTKFIKKKRKKKNKIKYPDIDLKNWSVTVPTELSNGKPVVLNPPEIFNYNSDPRVISYMYLDSLRGAIVFTAKPTNATTPNSKYSRSELREQMVSGNNSINWSFKDGAIFKGKLSVDKVSRDSDGKYHRIIIMQIHGRLSNDQRDLIGQKDNNAPPILKIYWDKGKIRVKTKKLKDINTTYPEILDKNAWTDDNGFNFEQEVGFRKFNLEVRVSEGKMTVILNNNEYKTYKGIHIDKWGVFENYFKAGNYFQTRDKDAFSKVSYFNLEVQH